MQSSRIFKANFDTFSFLYRLFDLIVLVSSLPLVAEIYQIPLSRDYLIALLSVAVLFLYTAEVFGVYRNWRAGKLLEMSLTAGGCVLLSFIFYSFLSFEFQFTNGPSTRLLFLWFLLATALTFSWRYLMFAIRTYLIKSGRMVKKVAIIGATDSGTNLYEQIQLYEELGYDFVGFFDDRRPERVFREHAFAISGNINQAIEMARTGEIHTLFITLPLKAQTRISEILRLLGNTTADVHFMPDFLVSNLMYARITQIANLDTISVFESPYQGANEWLKRSEDVILSSFILLLISIPMALIALCIKLTSPGSVFFKQKRYGLDGTEINVWKFRTMFCSENGGDVKQVSKDDNRVTPLGRFLRRTSLDELPQFINVLMGSMSIVGPRPHAVCHNEEYRKKVNFYMIRHKVKPGITGWAQVNGWRGETETLDKMENRVKCDLQYIKHWSLWFDIKIIFMTIFKGFMGKNAY